jgi:hypothetical protein
LIQTIHCILTIAELDHGAELHKEPIGQPQSAKAVAQSNPRAAIGLLYPDPLEN